MTRCFLVSVVIALLHAPANRAATFLYVSVAAEKRIAVYRLDPQTGNLTHQSDCKVSDGEPVFRNLDLIGKREL